MQGLTERSLPLPEEERQRRIGDKVREALAPMQKGLLLMEEAVTEAGSEESALGPAQGHEATQ